MAGVGDYKITMQNRPQEGTTPLSAESPESTATQSPNITRKGAVLAGYAGMAAKTTYTTITSEIEASGNERLAAEMSNAASAVGNVTVIAATSGWAAIPMVIQGTAQLITEKNQRARENRATQIENRLRGNRLNLGQGGGFNG